MPQPTAPAPTAAATPATARSTSRRVMSDLVLVLRSSESLFALMSVSRLYSHDCHQGKLVLVVVADILRPGGRKWLSLKRRQKLQVTNGSGGCAQGRSASDRC